MGLDLAGLLADAETGRGVRLPETIGVFEPVGGRDAAFRVEGPNRGGGEADDSVGL